MLGRVLCGISFALMLNTAVAGDSITDTKVRFFPVH